MLGIQVCATDQDRFFTFKNLEQALIFEVLLQNRSLCLSQSLSANCIATNLCCVELLAFCSLMLIYSGKKNSIDKRIESFHYRSIILEQSFLIIKIERESLKFTNEIRSTKPLSDYFRLLLNLGQSRVSQNIDNVMVTDPTRNNSTIQNLRWSVPNSMINKCFSVVCCPCRHSCS